MDSSFFNDYIKKNLSDKNKSDKNKSYKNDTGKTEKICHITFEPLEKNYIIFDCSHTFNYDAIFKEVCIQKTIINNKETQKLKKYCIKCPYCRFIQNGILPYREPYNLVPLVNTPKSKAFTMKKFKCKYGLSDHSGSIYPSIYAMVEGATIIEVHVATEKNSKNYKS